MEGSEQIDDRVFVVDDEERRPRRWAKPRGPAGKAGAGTAIAAAISAVIIHEPSVHATGRVGTWDETG